MSFDPKKLDKWDIDLLKSIVIQKYTSEKIDVVTASIEEVFRMLNAMGYKIELDPTKEVTWSKPKSSWYTPYKPNKTDW